MEQIKDEFKDSLIGLSKEDAINECEENNITYRVTRIDNTNYAITCDLRFDRINIEIDKDIVSSVDVG